MTALQLMEYNNHDLIWTCPSCGKKNIEPMHSDPEAHFVSMNCEYCDEEYDGCLCDSGTIIPYQSAAQMLGRRGGQATKKSQSKDFYSRIGKKGMKKRWATK